MRLSDSRYEFIKQTVADVFTRYGVTGIPISAHEVAAKMGITVVPYEAFPAETQKLLRRESMDAFFVEKPDERLFIYYNSEPVWGRINHSIMHEIGHIVLGHTQESDLAESEAKFFAKYALAPPVLVDRVKPHDPYQLAGLFDISLEAACFAWDYYQKWLYHSRASYAGYESQMLRQFRMIG